jgi:hypothetical protein
MYDHFDFTRLFLMQSNHWIGLRHAPRWNETGDGRNDHP